MEATGPKQEQDGPVPVLPVPVPVQEEKGEGSKTVPEPPDDGDNRQLQNRLKTLEEKLRLTDNIFNPTIPRRGARGWDMDSDDDDQDSVFSDTSNPFSRPSTYQVFEGFIRNLLVIISMCSTIAPPIPPQPPPGTVVTRERVIGPGQQGDAKSGEGDEPPESPKDICTKAFLSGQQAAMTTSDWETFLQSRDRTDKNARVLFPIEVPTSEPDPDVILKLDLFNLNKSTKPEPFAPVLYESVAYAGDMSQEALAQQAFPERIKIHSDALVALHYKLEDQELSNPNARGRRVRYFGRSMVIPRPFKLLSYHGDRFRNHLKQLEEAFQDYKGDDNPVVTVEAVAAKLTADDKLTVEGAAGKQATTADEKEHDDQKDEKGIENEDVEKVEEMDDPAASISALLHLRCLLKFVDDHLQPKIQLLRSKDCQKVLFQDLWHLFKPGDEVIDQLERQAYRVISVKIPSHKVVAPWERWLKRKPLRPERIRSRSRRLPRRARPPTPDRQQDEEEEMSGDTVKIHCAYIDFDGRKIGPVVKRFVIPSFGGPKNVKSFPIYPLRLADDPELRKRLAERGRMLLDVTQMKSMYYTGVTLDSKDEVDSQVVVDFSEALTEGNNKEWEPKIDSIATFDVDIYDLEYDKCDAACCRHEWILRGDFVDRKLTEQYMKSLVPTDSFQHPSLIFSPRPVSETGDSWNQPTEDEFVVMTYRVFAFVLRSRKWAQLDLTYLRYEDTQTRNSVLTAFDRLVLPAGHKEMVQSLVSQHFRDKSSPSVPGEQTDIVRGKGKGLIMLLHGAPGVGKTTTAEGVAERFHKPLFQITCGDLGTTAREVEQELEKNFSLASRWGCILLLDEADVFLAARERKDFARNGLVAVFLRVLEYYTGILFLTTNRVGDFDEGFASRIHMSLYYPELDLDKSKKVFKLNLDLIQERFLLQNRKITFDVSSIEEFAETHYKEHKYSRWNGRQIRNACQTALALAEFDAYEGRMEDKPNRKDVSVELQLRYFRTVQTAYLDFGQYLGDIYGTQGDRRAQDNFLRARKDTPYDTTGSLFRKRAEESRSGVSSTTGFRHTHASMDSHASQGDSFQPLVSQGYQSHPNFSMRSYPGQDQQQLHGQYMSQMGGMSGMGMGMGTEIAQQPGRTQGQMDHNLFQSQHSQHNQQNVPMGGGGPSGQSWMGGNPPGAGGSYHHNIMAPQAQSPYGFNNMQQQGTMSMATGIPVGPNQASQAGPGNEGLNSSAQSGRGPP